MKRLLSILLAIVFTLGATACGTSGGTASSSDNNKSGGKVDTVNIGTMNLVNGDLIAQYEKYYENELGVKVNLIQFNSGKDVNTALAAGSVDISEIGSSPTALGLSSGTEFEVFWIGDIIGSAESLAVKNSSGIDSVKGLKGKKIATPFASTAHYSLLNALKLEGISESDVTIIDLQPSDIYAAWQRGDIDGAYIWYPVLDQLLEDGKTITDSKQLSEQNVITADLNVVRTEFAENNPEVVTKYVEAQIKANDILLNDTEKAAEAISSILNISVDDAKNQITQFEYLTAEEQLEYLEDKLPTTLKNTADFLVSQKSIKEALDLETFKSKINTEFIETAIK